MAWQCTAGGQWHCLQAAQQEVNDMAQSLQMLMSVEQLLQEGPGVKIDNSLGASDMHVLNWPRPPSSAPPRYACVCVCLCVP